MQDAGCRMQDNRNIEKDIIVIPIINCKTTRFHKKPFLRKKSFTNNFFTFSKNLD